MAQAVPLEKREETQEAFVIGITILIQTAAITGSASVVLTSCFKQLTSCGICLLARANDPAESKLHLLAIWRNLKGHSWK